MDVTLSEAFTYLVAGKNRNFYAKLVASLIRQEKPGLGTMAVGINRDGKYVLFYDPAFVHKVELTELVLTCMHEVLHLLLGHISRFLNLLSGLVSDEEKKKYKLVMNPSADLAANELMRLEKGFDDAYGEYFYGSEKTDGRLFLTPEKYGLERNLPFEAYIFHMLSRLETKKQDTGAGQLTVQGMRVPGAGQSKGQGEGKKNNKDGKGGGDGDEKGNDQGEQFVVLDAEFNPHKFWEADTEGMTSEEIQGLSDRLQNELRVLVRNAAKGIKGRGTLPAGVEELIEKILKTPTVPWPHLLRTLCVRTRETKISRGMSRPNRRMHGIPQILPFPGRDRDRKFTILFVMDTSGSMGGTELTLGFNELLNIVQTEEDVHLWVMYCDAALQMTYEVKSIEDINFNVAGRGGTDFNPPFIKCREMLQSGNGPDILIYCTDGYAPAPEEDNRIPIPVVWLLTPNHTVPSPDYGHHIVMEPF